MHGDEVRDWLVELCGPGAAADACGPFLVVAAHPDDETIGTSWLLARAPGVRVLQMTDGAPRDPKSWPASAPPTREAYAALRRRETERALACIGIPPRHIANLGFADQDLSVAMTSAVEALSSAIARLAPRVVVTHPYEGGHPDHDATAVAVRAALALSGRAATRAPHLLEMTSYHAREGAVRTGAFLAEAEHEVARTLSERDRLRKRQMFAEYASQAEVLAWFRIDEERYRPAPPLRLDRAPHPGALFYEILGLPMQGERFRRLAKDALSALGLGASELV